MVSCRIRYLGVPHQSTLLLSTEGDGAYQAQAIVVSDTSAPEHHGKAELDPGPLEVDIEAPNIYIARVKIQITGGNTSTVILKARVRKSDGTPYSVMKPCHFLKSDGNTHFAQVMIVTEPEQ